jgi:hypothetical protein
MIRDEAFYDYSVFIPFTDMQSIFMNVTRGKKSASEAIESVAGSFQESLDKRYNDYLE